MSTGCQKTIFPYVNMSVCQYVRIELFSLGIKMKVVQNVIRMADSQKISSQKVSTDSYFILNIDGGRSGAGHLAGSSTARRG